MATGETFDIPHEVGITDMTEQENIEMQDMNQFVNTDLDDDLHIDDLTRRIQEVGRITQTQCS